MSTTVSTPATVAAGSVLTVVARPNHSGGANPSNPLGSVTWASSDATKATVQAAGTPGGAGQSTAITGVAAGTCTITATAANGEVSTLALTVTAADDPNGFSIDSAPPLVV